MAATATHATSTAIIPWYQDAVDFCHRWDQAAFDPEYESLPLEFFEPMVRRLFAREPFSLAPRGQS